MEVGGWVWDPHHTVGGVAHLLLGQAAQLGDLVGDGLLLLLGGGKGKDTAHRKESMCHYEYEPIK